MRVIGKSIFQSKLYFGISKQDESPGFSARFSLRRLNNTLHKYNAKSSLASMV